MFDDKMVTNRVERVFVQSANVGLFKAFVKFKIEDLESQSLRRSDFILTSREPRSVTRGRIQQQAD
jgi:hypothetical protein